MTADPSSTRPDLPVGTVTFLRTDVEGSMRLTQALGPRWDAVNDAHQAIVRRAVVANDGVVVRTEGDALFAVFGEAGAAVTAAVDAQRGLAEHEWPPDAVLLVRMALHSGEAHAAGDDYGGIDVSRAARIAAVGHGGQIILSGTTRALVEGALPVGTSLHDLGEHALRDLPRPERLYQLDVAGLRTEFPPLRAAAAAPGDLPTRLTSFIGRNDEQRNIAALLSERRLVTLTGPGGIGKTSLAVEVARAVADGFADGAWFVALAQVDDPTQVRATIARTLGLFDGPGRDAADALAPYLADRSVLLVLDNFERLLDAAPDISSLLDASPASRVLVTSRAPLRLAGEQEFPIPPMDDDRTRLFDERARAVDPSWDPRRDAATVREICELLDGLPLGVELAAARVSILPVRAIRDRLASHLPLPGSGPRNVPDRQRTLEGTFAWSHDLLTPGLQQALHDLAVFDGSFDLEQAQGVIETEAVDDDPLEALVALAEQSLIMRDAVHHAGGGMRFRLLSPIRGFALARLAAEEREVAARRRHAEAYLALAEAAAPAMTGRGQPAWLDRLSLEHDNIRAAIRWAIEAGESAIALRFLAAIWRFWQQDGYLVEATELAEAALAVPGADEPTPHLRAALSAAGGIAYWHGRPTDALRHYEEELVVARQIGEVAGEADALWNLAYGRFLADDIEGAYELLEAAKRGFELVHDDLGAAHVEWSLSTLAGGFRPGLERLPVFEALLERFERLDDPWYAAQTMTTIAWLHFHAGDMAEASRWYVRSLVSSLELRDVTGTTVSLQVAAIVALEAGRPDAAAELLGASEHLCEVYGVKPPLGLQVLIGQAAPHERVAGILGEERYAERFHAGRQLTIDEAVGLVVQLYYERYSDVDRR